MATSDITSSMKLPPTSPPPRAPPPAAVHRRQLLAYGLTSLLLAPARRALALPFGLGGGAGGGVNPSEEVLSRPDLCQARPIDQDFVVVRYVGRFADGTPFDTRYADRDLVYELGARFAEAFTQAHPSEKPLTAAEVSLVDADGAALAPNVCVAHVASEEDRAVAAAPDALQVCVILHARDGEAVGAGSRGVGRLARPLRRRAASSCRRSRLRVGRSATGPRHR